MSDLLVSSTNSSLSINRDQSGRADSAIRTTRRRECFVISAPTFSTNIWKRTRSQQPPTDSSSSSRHSELRLNDNSQQHRRLVLLEAL